MPFLPFVLLLVWQVIGRSASFALGWATALYFGQVPGKQGHVLALISLVSAGWVLLLAGFGVPLLVGAAADALGLVPRNFDLDRWIVLGLGAALVLAPPLLDWLDRRPPLDPARYAVARLLDDAGYSVGVWQGCVERRTVRPLLPVLRGRGH